ncbi:MAG: DUF3084 domain-containing protein [Bacillota bacterium]
MQGLILVVVLIVFGGLISYLGDRVGMKVGKNRLSIFGLRPKHTSVIITIATGILIAVISLTLILVASEKARVAVFRLNDLLVEIEASQQELAALKQNKLELEGQLDNLSHNLKLFGRQYFSSLNQELVYERGAEISTVSVSSREKLDVEKKLENWLEKVNKQAKKLGLTKIHYNAKELEKLLMLLKTNHKQGLVRLVAANNIFQGGQLIVNFELVGG